MDYLQQQKAITELYGTMPNAELAKKLGISRDALKARIYRMRESGKATRTLEHDQSSRANRIAGRTLQHRYDAALEQIDKLQTMLGAFKSLNNSHSTFDIQPTHGTQSEATAVACFSDVHIGETVTHAQTNGLNQYSVSIARERSARFFESVVKLTRKERQNVKISELVLFIGGDIIDGALHLDTIQSAELSEPMKQAVIAQEIIESGLIYLKKHGGFKRITIVCKDGNHGRVSQKLHSSSRAGNALEWFMFYNLAHRHPELRWIVEEGLLTYLPIYSYNVRFHHGDAISFGGINEFYTFLNRRIMQWNLAKKADLDVLGHLHAYRPTRRWIVNGSVVGYNAYAVSLGAQFEPPIQAYFLIDKKRGVSVQIPIFCS